MWVGRGDRHQEVKKKYNMQKKNMDQNQGGREGGGLIWSYIELECVR